MREQSGVLTPFSFPDLTFLTELFFPVILHSHIANAIFPFNQVPCYTGLSTDSPRPNECCLQKFKTVSHCPIANQNVPHVRQNLKCMTFTKYTNCHHLGEGYRSSLNIFCQNKIASYEWSEIYPFQERMIFDHFNSFFFFL